MKQKRKHSWLSPAHEVIGKFNLGNDSGVDVLADRLNISRTSVYRWMYPRGAQGTGGRIPSRYHKPILLAARQLGIPLTPIELTGLAEFVDEPEAA